MALLLGASWQPAWADASSAAMPGMAMPPAPAASASAPSGHDRQGMQGMQPGKAAGRTPPLVGSLPQSDGSAPHSYAYYGIDNKEMHDDPLISKLLLDNLEYVHGDTSRGVAWDGQYRLGYNINALLIRSEGSHMAGQTQDADVELLWAHTYAPFWDVVSGVRRDFAGGPGRNWVSFGVQGLAPYEYDVEATAYAGPEGRTAARLKTSIDVLLTQRLIFTPELEANAYGRNDPARGIGSGLSDATLSLRLRYEIRREFAPYLGFSWARKFGTTADLALAAGEPVLDHQILAGVRVWF
ncbi:MAG: copper resistance protein B [Betaproteobacteria bacterium]|nr:copper resistance protein B [Betaproteobacteria bacterium]